VTDAVTDTSEGAHFYSLEVISPRIAELATTNEVLAAIENGHRPEGRNTKIGATGK
jgi:isochorismate hydrolase